MQAFRILLLCLCACVAMAEDKPKASAPEPPRNLEEAHQQLETQLSADQLAKIDAMKSDKEMVEFYLSIGMAIRNTWGLWGGSPLANNLWKLGFSHPDDMSSVILETLWCKRHHRDFRLEERADYFQAYWKAAANPPATALDPADDSEVEWTLSFGAGTNDKPRQIHVGRSKKSGRWLAYEYDKGVYLPKGDLVQKIKVFTDDPFSGKK